MDLLVSPSVGHSADSCNRLQVRTLAHPPPKSDTISAPPPPVADLEDLCSLCEPVSVSLEAGVTIYPMAKERKKPREEETAVCVLEWQSSVASETENGGRKVLIVKRPEKGWSGPSGTLMPAPLVSRG